MKYPNPITGGASGGANWKPRACPRSEPNEYQSETTAMSHTNRVEKNNFGDGKKDSNIFLPSKYFYRQSLPQIKTL